MSFPYDKAEYEELPCNLCGRDDFEILAHRDRNWLAVRTVICRYCGLISLNPRMTQEWYGKFYDHGYREERARQKGDSSLATPAGPEKIFRSGLKFGVPFASQIASYLRPGPTIEVGSSCGGILTAFREVRPDLEPIGIEPSAREAAYAKEKGIPTITSLFEALGAELPKAANIVIARSLNHLLDPKKFFIWAYHQLEPHGPLVIAVQDFRLSAKKKGSIAAATQIDHTYMLTRETLENFVRAAGFDILFFDASEGKSFQEWTEMRKRGLTDHLRLVAAKSEREPFGDPSRIRPLGGEVRRSLSWLNLMRYHIPFRIHRAF